MRGPSAEPTVTRSIYVALLIALTALPAAYAQESRAPAPAPIESAPHAARKQAPAPIELPPLVQPASSETHPGKMIWADLVTPNLKQAEQFYGGLFRWTFQPVGGD